VELVKMPVDVFVNQGGIAMGPATTFGSFVLQTATGAVKRHTLPDNQAKEVREQLSQRIVSRVEEIRNLQRKAFDESKAVTVF
jgi:hypothetical protein